MCPRYLRQAIALQPCFLYFAELGRVLGKLGKLEASRIILQHLFERRSFADSHEEWTSSVQAYLVTLSRCSVVQELAGLRTDHAGTV